MYKITSVQRPLSYTVTATVDKHEHSHMYTHDKQYQSAY